MMSSQISVGEVKISDEELNPGLQRQAVALTHEEFSGHHRAQSLESWVSAPSRVSQTQNARKTRPPMVRAAGRSGRGKSEWDRSVLSP